LASYTGNDFLDRVIFLPLSEDIRRRIWLLTPRSTPSIQLDEIRLEPIEVKEGRHRWIDYGVASLPFLRAANWSGGYFAQLRLFGMKAEDCISSHLIFTEDLVFFVDDSCLEEVERRLWGLARKDAGVTRLDPAKSTAGSAVTFRVQYTAGPAGLPRGARVRFAVPNLFTTPQTDAPDTPGYVSILDTDCDVVIHQIATSVEAHEDVDIICRFETDLAPGTSFNLQYRTNQTQIFPYCLDEVDREWWFAHIPPLAAAVSVSENKPFVSLLAENSHTFELISGRSARLHLFLPGRLLSTDRVVLKGTYTDHFRNVPPRGSVPVEIKLWLSRSGERVNLGSPVEHFVDGHRFELQLPDLEPGIYRVHAHDKESGEEIARSNPLDIVSPGEGAERLYWGEIHAHTEMSDGSGAYPELFRHAKEDGCLDFAGAADHAVNFSDNQWEWMQDITNTWNAPGKFVAIIGYEWGGKQMHRNVYSSRKRLDLIRGRMLMTSQVEDLWQHFQEDDDVVGGGHASLGHGLVWEMHDPEVERFIEIYSMWGASDFKDNPLSMVGSPLSADWNWERPGAISVNEILQSGAKLGFTGGGDCHEGHAGFSSEDPDGQGTTSHTFASALAFRCGMTAALMPNLDRKSLIRALRNRKTYATTGARILLDFTAAGYAMGSIGKTEKVICIATVYAVHPLKTVEIIKDGSVVWKHETSELDTKLLWQDPDPTSGESYYYLHVIQQDGQEAWSSPIWIQA